jgi:hypothetical protein
MMNGLVSFIPVFLASLILNVMHLYSGDTMLIKIVVHAKHAVFLADIAVI